MAQALRQHAFRERAFRDAREEKETDAIEGIVNGALLSLAFWVPVCLALSQCAHG